MARMKSWMPEMPVSRSSAVEDTAAAQDESVTGRMTEPTVRQLK